MTQDAVRRLDTGDMYGAIRTFPDQWRQGRAGALATDLLGLTLDGLRHVVVVGMGGSAIGGDLLRTLAQDTAPVPISVVRTYTLPAWVGSESLVIASSYSGNTEETLAAMDDAGRRGARLACIASGGEMLQRATEAGLPFIAVPGGMQPRAALGYSLTALLSLAEGIGLLRLPDAAWSEAQDVLDVQADELGDLTGNRALTLAERLIGLLPLVYTGTGLLEAVALRWQTQFHENSKTLAAGNVFPEFNHNEIMGWEGRAGLLSQIGVVVLRDREDHLQVRRRMDITRELLEDRAGWWVEVESRSTTPLARVLSLVNLGDWVSFYLAIQTGVDPTPVTLISRLKETLAA